MENIIRITHDLTGKESIVLMGKDEHDFSEYLNEKERQYLQQQIKNKQTLVSVNQYERWVFIYIHNVNTKEAHDLKEELRKAGAKLNGELNAKKIKEITIVDNQNVQEDIIALTEGLVLANYKFVKYIKDSTDKKPTLQQVNIFSTSVSTNEIREVNTLTKAVYYTRNLVNEPLSYLNAEKLAEEIQSMGDEAGFHVKTYDKAGIEQLKFGGLLAVNRGSIDPPTFSVLEWNPEQPVNAKPVILVGKGVVYDTGGLSLKNTRGSMDEMKSDMSGAAVVAGVMYSLAALKIPVHVIGLVPATDNRPDGNAYTPGDVITMHDGSTVEVMNTDAEGRMIMADALSYAKQYKPELVIDIATLTGSAAIAIGKHGIVGMGNAPDAIFQKLITSSYEVFERVVKFPFWNEYKDLLTSDIADMKNIGGREAGAITAGKFLEHFTDYPYIHLDIAGTAFVKENDSYRGKGATGSGVRLLYHFLKHYSDTQ
jgi:leucyl aminopeptidase